ncbi:hypothetical protein BAUCODRAFT_261783 [Baudoinia panamericana UAMH 10762]|uniref:Uncharacterized protein n=1 Tax=Baudoinia panamericana (strain UAMH 10762) TaxID=717646 RepID=M2N259_BAUPA|nr:uncharacterized protein BAUCODRAFT_261783 [Baudoinia panamericana UAMH 10762]EMC92765.1 hypothetical protein BAUCODRAFT_261783 [Baudoinia panamericana UAMH 10762]
MSFLRSANTSLLRPIGRSTPRLGYISRRAASQDYGSGEGDPTAEKGAQLGKNPSEHLEHPGPPAPSTGGSNNGSQQGQQGSSGQQPQGAQKSDGSAEQQSQRKGTQGAQPKILADSPPPSDEASKDVQEHNRDMDKRAEKANEKVSEEDYEKDKVPKGFWGGELMHISQIESM